MTPPDITERFTGRAEVYARFRPEYPRELLTHLAAACGLQPRWVVADVGSGTGKLTTLFLSNGNVVHAIEPNADMRKAAEIRLSGDPRFMSIDARAEATGLPSGSVDLVAAGQAFHWFDVERAREEFHRILRPGGFVLLVWNRRETNATPYLHAYEEFLRRYSVDYAQVHHGKLTDKEALRPFFAADYGVIEFANPRKLDFAAVQGGYLSTSYSLPSGHALFPQAMGRLRGLFDAHQRGGLVDAPLRTVAHYGRL